MFARYALKLFKARPFQSFRAFANIDDASDPEQSKLKAAESAHEFIDRIIKANKVVLFMKGTPDSPQCGFSNYVVQALKYYRVEDFQAVNVLEDPEVREEIKKYSDWPTLPQLYINQEFVGGCDILTDMHQKGTLMEFFEKNGVVKKQKEE
ncbi:unnamed protein product [Blepharisma stoltei]|uniref:Glutaredoxin domain-containing protein n=1 Tax=Blepharisma stoltei TaxID=1481888 RepID=A0AAU9IGH6_9CILI|nr:unnamed protein product [Blepharisma stoltei]